LGVWVGLPSLQRGDLGLGECRGRSYIRALARRVMTAQQTPDPGCGGLMGGMRRSFYQATWTYQGRGEVVCERQEFVGVLLLRPLTGVTILKRWTWGTVLKSKNGKEDFSTTPVLFPVGAGVNYARWGGQSLQKVDQLRGGGGENLDYCGTGEQWRPRCARNVWWGEKFLVCCARNGGGCLAKARKVSLFQERPR